MQGRGEPLRACSGADWTCRPTAPSAQLCIFLWTYTGAYAGFLREGGPTLKFLGFGYTCREAVCREQRSCEPLLGGFGGMLPQENF